LKEYIFAFMYKPNPRAYFKVGSVWATDVRSAAAMAAEALKNAYPDHVKDRLFRASDTRYNRQMLPVPDPDSDGWLTPSQAREKENQRVLQVA
jgi:hypothetical protein